MIGRIAEQKRLKESLRKSEAQLVAVYGRRRDGKTFLVRQTFGDAFYFSHAGLAHGKMADQLQSFRDSLVRHGAKGVPALHDWREAFNSLRDFIEAGGKRGKKIVFIDEMPCLTVTNFRFVE